MTRKVSSAPEARVSIVGRTYLERGEPVKVLAQWRGEALCRHAPGEAAACEHVTFQNYRDDTIALCLRINLKRSPRNVLLQRADGSLVVRPFRGLRKPKEEA